MIDCNASKLPLKFWFRLDIMAFIWTIEDCFTWRQQTYARRTTEGDRCPERLSRRLRLRFRIYLAPNTRRDVMAIRLTEHTGRRSAASAVLRRQFSPQRNTPVNYDFGWRTVQPRNNCLRLGFCDWLVENCLENALEFSGKQLLKAAYINILETPYSIHLLHITHKVLLRNSIGVCFIKLSISKVYNYICVTYGLNCTWYS